MSQALPSLSVDELHNLMTSEPDKVFLLDIRRGDEFKFSNIGGSHISMQELPDRLAELPTDPDSTIAVLCRSGARSARVTAYLLENGFPTAKNVSGGILAWSDHIDPDVRKY